MQPLRFLPLILLTAPLEGCLGLDYFFEDTAGLADVDVDVDVDTDTDSDVDIDTDTDTDVMSLDIDSIEPDYGSNGGGSSVEIRGGPFNQSVKVKFGNSEATILQVNQGIVRVQTPVTSQEGLVDVTITTNDGAGQRESGFTFWPDATGQGGAFGEVRWIQWLGQYWSTPPENEGYAWWALTEPTDEHYYHWAYAPADDTCANGYYYTNSFRNYNLGLSSTAFDVNGRRINLTDTSGQQIWETTLTQGDFVAGARYSLEEVAGSGFPTFSMQEITQAPNSFVVTNPYMDGSTPPTVGRSFPITWSGATADRIVMIVERFDSNYTSQEVITCVANNDGSFSIPSSAWSGWDSNGLVFILVGALNEGGGTFPFNNAESRVASTYFLAGGAWTQ